MDLIAKRPVYINGAWVQPGQPVPYGVAGFDYERLARKGSLESVNGDEVVNPELVSVTEQSADNSEVSAEANRLTADLASVRELFPEAKNTAEVVAQIKELQSGRQTDTDTLSRLQAELETAKANAAKPEDAEALAEYRDVVGTLLPHDFPGRKVLLENGYYTAERVKATSNEQLGSLKGIADKTLESIREVAPYTEPKG